MAQQNTGYYGAYRGNGTNKAPTEEEVKRLEVLGIILERKERNVTQEFIEKIEKLQEIGIDVLRMKQKDTIETLASKSGIKREELEKLGLNPEELIGQVKSRIAQAYRGKGKQKPPTEEEVKRLEGLGISLNKKRRTGKEIAEASISSLADIEMADREDLALSILVEKQKEGGIKVNE